jgi:acetyl-CoA carboxylase biotin carboxyl carrier protein
MADLAGIDALIDRLVPALTAKLSGTHLGELEVRDGDWRIRLRRPAGAGGWNGELRRSSDRAGRGQPGHEGHPHGRAAVEAHRLPTLGGSNGTGAASGTSQAIPPGHAGPGASAGPGGHAGPVDRDDETRRVATSPAVGVFRPGPRAAVGTRVREGDVLGHVDVLGVAEELLSPAAGIVGEMLVEAGTAVEYGQPLLVVALAALAEAAR